ncbi:cation:proton antiporter [Luteibacter aegosomaticola]|uniref:cation:proton antiporter n=1 Tax=Luteibacter aegosomaticola TaxID=2911538 RepID=UPI001FFC202C|nr:cation:proton antiporter [Luteibacter aegosomaticola]UPG88213.1 cation:proton antiporter [Luteibacter aegosomaticola]
MTTFAIYLLGGVAVGPGVFALTRLPLTADHIHWLRSLSEAAMVVSLFITGLKLRLPFSHGGWRMSLRLALAGMALTAAGVTLLAVFALGWSLPWALALAAIVSPTDPVLASLVSVDDARDDDALRVAVSGEAGLNDATALPVLFLALALMVPGATLDQVWMHWLSVDVFWGLLGGVTIGFLGGWGMGHLGIRLRHATRDVAPSDFLALGIVIGVYAAAEWLHASGFLAAFAAGVGLRRVELHVSQRTANDHAADPADLAPAETRVNPNERAGAAIEHPGHTVGWVVSDALSFGETVERLIAAALVMAVGIAAVPALSWTGAGVAICLMALIRPIAVWLSTIGSPVPWQRRALIGWFGIRGLGSLNYLAFAIGHGLEQDRLGALEGIVITVVTVSVLVHGVSVTPLMRWRSRALKGKLDSRNTD